jgi:non-ribosomal peptide synthetase-like protein
VVQTGSNFGEAVKHDSPYLTSVGSGTMVADGLSVSNAEFSSTSFRVSRASIGAHSFLGNAIAYPAEAKVGDDVLLATKVMVPIDGEVRQGVGLLGSPAFEIPRTVFRDATIDAHLQAPGELARRLAAKNRHNLRTMGLFLLLRWVNLFVATLITTTGVDLTDRYGALPVAASMVLDVLFVTAVGVLVERAATGFRPMSPQQCSTHDPYFWWHERYWKLAGQPAFFNGTPFKNLIWACWVSGSAAGCSTTAPPSRSGPWSPSGTVAPSTSGPRSRATRRRTAASSPTGSPSAPASPSGSAPGCTTA